jgi:hypothetical protein
MAQVAVAQATGAHALDVHPPGVSLKQFQDLGLYDRLSEIENSIATMLTMRRGGCLYLLLP